MKFWSEQFGVLKKKAVLPGAVENASRICHKILFLSLFISSVWEIPCSPLASNGKPPLIIVTLKYHNHDNIKGKYALQIEI